MACFFMLKDWKGGTGHYTETEEQWERKPYCKADSMAGETKRRIPTKIQWWKR